MTEDQDTRLSTPIVSPPASALRSTPIPGDIADGRSDKIRAVAQQAHDNGDCVCCMDDTDLVFTRNEIIPSDTITITISREDGEWWHKHYEPAAYPSGGPWEAIRRVDAAIRAALEEER